MTVAARRAWWTSIVLMAGLGSGSGAAESVNKRAERMTTPYQAEYDVVRRGRTRGSAGRELLQTSDGTWRYLTHSRVSYLLLSDRRENDTEFRLNEGRVEPLAFEYSREGVGSNRYLHVIFDRDQRKLDTPDGDGVAASWRDGLLDANALLHQLQLDVAGGRNEWTYELIDEAGENVRYTFRREGEEIVDIPFGQVSAVKVVRVRDHDRRETLFWFAPEQNHTLVKMQEIREGRELAILALRSLSFR